MYAGINLHVAFNVRIVRKYTLTYKQNEVSRDIRRER